MKTKLFSALAVAALAAPIALSIGSASAADANSVDPKDSSADFNVIASTDPTNPADPDGKLILNTVPNFHFGDVKSSEIYAGFNAKTSTGVDDTLEVDDNRLGDGTKANDWTLTAQMGDFVGATSNAKLAGATLNLPATAGTLGGSETTDAAAVKSTAATVATGHGAHGNDTFNIANATLDMPAMTSVNLTKEAFTATVTWNLSSTTPVAPTA